MDGRANPLMDRGGCFSGVVFSGVVAMVAVVTSHTNAGCSVAYIVKYSCICSWSCGVV